MLLKFGREKSPWLFQLNTGSCNGCDIEIVALLASRYDAERFGCKLVGSPKHADICLVTGPVTARSKEPLLRVYDLLPDPKVIVCVGTCAINDSVFTDTYSVVGPASKLVPVSVFVGGCSAHPNNILIGITKAIQIFKEAK